MKTLLCLLFIGLFAGVQLAAIGTCHGGLGAVFCAKDPCMMTSCPAHADAKCVANYCGGCNADFYDSNMNLLLDCHLMVS